MKEITKEYLVLFGAITDALETLERLQAELAAAQQRAEELFLECGDEELCCNCTGQENAVVVS